MLETDGRSSERGGHVNKMKFTLHDATVVWNVFLGILDICLDVGKPSYWVVIILSQFGSKSYLIQKL